ncbi:hypothetical protein AB2I16_26475 (plasmid) [Escherichia coli]
MIYYPSDNRDINPEGIVEMQNGELLTVSEFKTGLKYECRLFKDE